MVPQSSKQQGHRSHRPEQKGEKSGGESGEGVVSDGAVSEVTPGLGETLERLMSSLARKRSGALRPDSLQVSIYTA